MARMSEEQWKDFKFKIGVGVVFLIVGACAYGIGPGLEKVFLQRARLRKTEAWAPEWYYKVGRVYEATFRTDKAVKVYEEFYLNWCGDERLIPALDEVMEESKFELEHRTFFPEVAGRYTKDTRPMWVGGEGAQPHPKLADVLMRLSRYEEDRRNFHTARYYYLGVLKCFPAGTQAHTQALAAQKRYASRSM